MTVKIPYIGIVTPHQLTALILFGMLAGAVLTTGLGNNPLYLKRVAQDPLITEDKIQSESAPLAYSRKSNSCSALCSQPPEKVVVQKKVVPRGGINAPGVTRVANIPKDPKNPNAIRISLAEAPTILSKVNKVNGKGTCIKKNDKGHKSKKFSKPHIDRQCCLDPDEIPNPRCLYK